MTWQAFSLPGADRSTIFGPGPQRMGMRPLADARSQRAADDLATAFAAHHAFVRDRLRGLGVAASDVDDATQDVFVVLVRRIADYDPHRPIRHWLAGMARRVARRYRDRGRTNVIPLDRGRAEADVDLDRALLRSEARDVLDAFLSRLDRDRWAVFVLAEIEGLRGTEIAAELDVNLNTVYARLKSARTELERALRRHRARERRGLAALLPFGLGLGRSSGGGAGWGWPVVGLAGVSLGVALFASRQGCVHDEDATSTVVAAPSASPSASVTPKAEAAHDERRDPPQVGGGLRGADPRPADPPQPAAKALTAPTPDADGWYSLGSGMGSSEGRTLSVEGRYRFDGERVTFETTYLGDDDAPFEVTATLAPEGLELVDGKLEDALTIGAGETRVMTQVLRAARDGCVSVLRERRSSERPPGSGTRSRHIFVLDGGRLRHPKDDQECIPFAHPTEEVLSGRMIDVDVHNECDIATEFVVFATPEGKRPPPSLPRERIGAGEHRRIQIDASQWILRVDRSGGAHVDGDSGEVRFFGEGCNAWSVKDRTGPPPARP